MKNFVITMLLLFTTYPLLAANTSTQVLATDCKQFVAVFDNGGKTTVGEDSFNQGTAYSRCSSFVAGYMEESNGELTFSNKEHTKTESGSWDNVTVNQMVRVFLKYVNENPEALNKDAVFVLWYSAYKAGLYVYTPTPIAVSSN